jgi:hypothetical protein
MMPQDCVSRDLILHAGPRMLSGLSETATVLNFRFRRAPD